MRTTVFATVRLEGYHCWPDAPTIVNFLRQRHRHIFHIHVEVPTDHDRAVEFILLGHDVSQTLRQWYGRPMECGTDSCETIARRLLETFNAEMVVVSEDGENGATVCASGTSA